MRRAVTACAALGLLLAPSAANAMQPGPVTPTAITYTFTSVSLVEAGGGYRSLTTEAFSHTFLRSDPDLAPVQLAETAVAFGRYAGISVCFDSTVHITLDGVRYDGPDGALFHHGEAITSVGADGALDGAVAPAGGAPATALPFRVSTADENCVRYLFPAPACVTDTPGTDCQAGDEVHPADGDAALSLDLLVDLFHGVIVDADTGKLSGMPLVQVTAGTPGASIHLSAFTDGVAADVSLLFGPAKELLSMVASKWPQQAGMSGMCAGQSAVYATAAPPGAAPLWDGPTFLGLFDASGLGKVQAPIAAQCLDNDHCGSIGVDVVTDLLQPVGGAASVTCVADADAAPPFLGYTYAGGSGGDGSLVTLPVTRVVDPAGLFGLCGAGAPGAVADHPGTCAAEGAAADGYL
jgi:hypothetical protein